MIKWLISQQVRAVNTSSKTIKEIEEERGKEKQTKRGGTELKNKKMNHKRKKPESEQPKWK